MAEENKVLIRTNPTITPKLISYPDYESSEAGKANRKLIDGTTGSFTQQKGTTSPIVKIGNAILPDSNLKSMNLRQDSFVPELTISFTDNDFAFTTRSYPLSNIIVSVYVKSNVKKLKSFYGDFIINSISSMAVPNSASIIYTLSGELYIPQLYGNYSKAYRNMTSTQVLQKVSEELQLGFADNQAEGTNDSMTWIMPNYTYKEFITQVLKFAYKDDNNFFDCFIDRYYILNFINVEKQFARDQEIDTGYVARDQSKVDKQRVDPETQTDNEYMVPLILTNHPSMSGDEFFISDFKLASDHGDILKKYAIRRYAYWYEHGSASPNTENEPTGKLESPPFRKHYLDPLKSTLTNDGKLPQTAELESLAPTDSDTDPAVTSNLWSGLDYGNAHPEYKFAELLNHHNWLETEKNTLIVTLSGFSVNLMRGSRVRVEIFLTRHAAALANAIASDPDAMYNQMKIGLPRYDSSAQAMIEDKALSDFYYVKTISYSYRDGKFTTTLALSRRHWLLPLAKNEIKI